MADQLPIISGTRAINATATASTSLIGRGLAAIQSRKLVAPIEIDEEKLLSLLVRIMDMAFRMGHLTFKENATYVLGQIRKECGKSANLITIEDLQASYISMKKGADSKNEFIKINSIEELYFDGEPLQFDPAIYKYGVIVAGAYIEAGERNYTEHTQAMITEFGEAVRPYLRSIYEGVRSFPEFDNSGMDDYQSIENTMVTPATHVKKGMNKQKILEVLQHIKKKYSEGTQKPNSQQEIENKINETSKPPNQHD
ncbi:MAG: hypothetical protein WC685_07995 [Methylobacter sp.]|jgi:hypothetical protein